MPTKKATSPPRTEREFMNIYLDGDEKAWARVEAARQGISLSAYVATLIVKERKRIERKQRIK